MRHRQGRVARQFVEQLALGTRAIAKKAERTQELPYPRSRAWGTHKAPQRVGVDFPQVGTKDGWWCRPCGACAHEAVKTRERSELAHNMMRCVARLCLKLSVVLLSFTQSPIHVIRFFSGGGPFPLHMSSHTHLPLPSLFSSLVSPSPSVSLPCPCLLPPPPSSRPSSPPSSHLLSSPPLLSPLPPLSLLPSPLSLSPSSSFLTLSSQLVGDSTLRVDMSDDGILLALCSPWDAARTNARVLQVG